MTEAQLSSDRIDIGNFDDPIELCFDRAASALTQFIDVVVAKAEA